MINNTSQKGFTLVEMVIVISLSSILMGSAAMMFSKGITSYFTAQRLNGLSIEAEQATLLFHRELRTAQKISSINTTSITFINHSGQSIIYDLNGTTFRRSENNGSNYYALSTHVSSLELTYFDTDLATTTTPSNVRLININLNFVENENVMPLVQTTYLRNIS